MRCPVSSHRGFYPAMPESLEQTLPQGYVAKASSYNHAALAKVGGSSLPSRSFERETRDYLDGELSKFEVVALGQGDYNCLNVYTTSKVLHFSFSVHAFTRLSMNRPDRNWVLTDSISIRTQSISSFLHV